MAGPWEKYAQPAPATGGPWERYAPAASENVIATTEDGGRVIRAADGSLSFTSPVFSTTDPAQIEKIMQGAKPADVSVSGFDEATIAQAPGTARAIKAVEGTPFIGSYVDEAAGAMFGDKSRDGVRALSGAMDRQRPGESTALSVGGGIAASIPLALAAAPAMAARAAGTIGARALQGGIVGALGGAVEGAMHGAGRGTDRSSRTQQGLSGGIIGGGLGLALGAAAPYAAEGVKRLLTSLKGTDVNVMAKQLGISPSAARVVKNALDAGDMQAAEDALKRAGPGAMLADAGQPAQELLDAAATTGGAAGRIISDAVDDRVTDASAKTVAILDSTLGKPSGLKTMGANVRSGTAAARDAAYQAAYASPIDYSRPRGQAIERFLKRVPQSAINDANELMRIEGATSAQIMASIAPDGSVTFKTMPDVRQIDYITRALSGVADKADGAGKLGGQTPLGRGYNELTKLIRRELRKEVPAYGKALDTASDAISRVKAGEAGYAMLRPGTTRETIATALDGASKAERDAMREGVRTYIDDTMANVTSILSDPNQDAREAIKALRLISSRSNKDKLRRLLGAKSANALLDELDQASVAFELRSALNGNSKTAIRQSIQRGVAQQTAPGALETLTSGEPINAGKRFVQLFTGNGAEAQALREAGIYEEIATALTQIRGARAEIALRTVKRAMAGQRVTEAQAAYVGNFLATMGALSAHQQGKTRLLPQ